eukprot:11905976-Alexandrium_andersonii.AAC.1
MCIRDRPGRPPGTAPSRSGRPAPAWPGPPRPWTRTRRTPRGRPGTVRSKRRPAARGGPRRRA